MQRFTSAQAFKACVLAQYYCGPDIYSSYETDEKFIQSKRKSRNYEDKRLKRPKCNNEDKRLKRPRCNDEDICKSPISRDDFWKIIPINCEIGPTVIPSDKMSMVWFHRAKIWGSRHPNQWMERKEVLKLSGGNNHSMRGALVPRSSTITPLFPCLLKSSFPPTNCLIMLKYNNLHYFMVWTH
jgi:hypothetical protein